MEILPAACYRDKSRFEDGFRRITMRNPDRRVMASVAGMAVAVWLGALTVPGTRGQATLMPRLQLERTLGGAPYPGCNQQDSRPLACTGSGCIGPSPACDPVTSGGVDYCVKASLVQRYECYSPGSDTGYNCTTTISGQCGAQYVGYPADDGSCYTNSCPSSSAACGEQGSSVSRTACSPPNR